MKKTALLIVATITVLLVGAFFVKPSELETPVKHKKNLILISAQLSGDGKLITDPEQWDPNKGFFITYMSVE